MFSVYKPYFSLVKFIPKYFLTKDFIVNGHLFIVYCHHLWLLPPSLSFFFGEMTSSWDGAELGNQEGLMGACFALSWEGRTPASNFLQT